MYPDNSTHCAPVTTTFMDNEFNLINMARDLAEKISKLPEKEAYAIIRDIDEDMFLYVFQCYVHICKRDKK
jgi:hypothetical protein